MALPQPLTDALAKIDADITDLTVKQSAAAAAQTAAVAAKGAAAKADQAATDAAAVVAAAQQHLQTDIVSAKAQLDQLGK